MGGGGGERGFHAVKGLGWNQTQDACLSTVHDARQVSYWCGPQGLIKYFVSSLEEMLGLTASALIIVTNGHFQGAIFSMHI